MTPKKQVSPVIRISRGERDASARATHLEAATGKFLVTTNERKYMSTKTNFKRIALVAVAALGLGVLSSVPAKADVTTLLATATNGTASIGANNDSRTAAIISVTAFNTLTTGDSITVNFVNNGTQPGTAVPYIQWLDTATGNAAPTTDVRTAVASVTSATRASAGKADTQTVGAATNLTITNTAAGYIGARFAVQLESSSTTLATAGSYNYTALVTSYKSATGSLGQGIQVGSATVNFSIVVSNASTSTTVVPGSSTAFIGAATGATADSVITAEATASSSAVAVISVRTKNASGNAAPESITATITGAGLLSFNSISGGSLTIKGDGTSDISVLPDGRAGTATITVSTTSASFANKTVVFYAKAAKTLTASVNNPTLAVGANASAVAVVAKDANGTNWSGQAYIVASSATDALVGGSATTPVACTYSSTLLTHFCPVTTIATGTAKFKVIDAATVALATATSNEVTVTVSNAAPASVKLAFDKASYSAGEKAYITVTVLDAAGKTLQGQTYANLFATGGISTSYAFGASSDTTTAVSVTTDGATSASTPTTAGSKTYTVYMPASGTVKITATGGASLPLAGQVAVSASATVSDSGSAALAAVTALATTVASLKTLITTLTNLVLKIQKKVKA